MTHIEQNPSESFPLPIDRTWNIPMYWVSTNALKHWIVFTCGRYFWNHTLLRLVHITYRHRCKLNALHVIHRQKKDQIFNWNTWKRDISDRITLCIQYNNYGRRIPPVPYVRNEIRRQTYNHQEHKSEKWPERVFIIQLLFVFIQQTLSSPFQSSQCSVSNILQTM